MGDVSRNQDFAEKFTEHPAYMETVGYIETTGSFAIYNPAKGIFEIQSEDAFDNRVYAFMRSCAKKSITMSQVKDVREQIKFLIPRKFESSNSPYLALKDCLLNTDTFASSPFNIANNCFFSMPFSSTELNADTFNGSRFARFLSEVLVTEEGKPDPELAVLVQELFGYCLLTTNVAEASFFLVGEGSNGKSVLLHILETIIGSQFCSSISIENMTTNRFATAGLVGMRLNICYEEESSFVKSDTFKALVSGEKTQIEYKYGKSYSAKMPVKYIFATNELPTFSGFNHGLLRRIKIIPFRRTFTDKDQDRNLTTTLLKELASITSWAIKGAKRLVANDYKFSYAKSSEDCKYEFESSLSAAVGFLRDEYTESENGFIFYSDLYTHFAEWCKENGKKQMSKQTFIRDVGRALKLESSVQWNPSYGKPERGRLLVRIGTTKITKLAEVVHSLPTF